MDGIPCHGIAWHGMTWAQHATACRALPYHAMLCYAMPCQRPGHHGVQGCFCWRLVCSDHYPVWFKKPSESFLPGGTYQGPGLAEEDPNLHHMCPSDRMHPYVSVLHSYASICDCYASAASVCIRMHLKRLPEATPKKGQQQGRYN